MDPLTASVARPAGATIRVGFSMRKTSPLILIHHESHVGGFLSLIFEPKIET
jgi:hypothetical protein